MKYAIIIDEKDLKDHSLAVEDNKISRFDALPLVKPYIIFEDGESIPLSFDQMVILRNYDFEKELLKDYKLDYDKIAVENSLVIEVYNTLHYIVMAKLAALQDKSDRLNSELRLVKKFADANKLGVIKDILAESEEKE